MEFSSLDTSACCNIIGSKITFYIRDKNGKNFRYFLRHQTCKNACREERKSVWVFLLSPPLHLWKIPMWKTGQKIKSSALALHVCQKRKKTFCHFYIFLYGQNFSTPRKPSGAMWKGLPSLSLSLMLPGTFHACLYLLKNNIISTYYTTTPGRRIQEGFEGRVAGLRVLSQVFLS